MADQRLYFKQLRNIWYGIVHRTTNVNHKRYVDYGGRGIFMCEKWHSFDFKSELDSLNLSLASEESLSDPQILKQLSTNRSLEKPANEPSLPKTDSLQRPKPPLAPRDQVARAAASEELERLKKQNMESYKKLCEAYLSSLKEEERQLFEAIKKQMTPVIFETQLRARLIRFMIENPTSWEPTKTVSKSQK